MWRVARLIAEQLSLAFSTIPPIFRAEYERAYTSSDKLDDDERKRLKVILNRTYLPLPLTKMVQAASGDTVETLMRQVLSTSVA